MFECHARARDFPLWRHVAEGLACSGAELPAPVLSLIESYVSLDSPPLMRMQMSDHAPVLPTLGGYRAFFRLTKRTEADGQASSSDATGAKGSGVGAGSAGAASAAGSSSGDASSAAAVSAASAFAFPASEDFTERGSVRLVTPRPEPLHDEVAERVKALTRAASAKRVRPCSVIAWFLHLVRVAGAARSRLCGQQPGDRVDD